MLPTFMRIHALLLVVFGLAFWVAPGPLRMLSLYGVPADGWEVVAFARLLGVFALSFAALLWTASRLPDASLHAIARTVCVLQWVGGALILIQQYAIWNNPTGALTVALFVLLAGAYSVGLTGKPLGG